MSSPSETFFDKLGDKFADTKHSVAEVGRNYANVWGRSKTLIGLEAGLVAVDADSLYYAKHVVQGALQHHAPYTPVVAVLSLVAAAALTTYTGSTLVRTNTFGAEARRREEEGPFGEMLKQIRHMREHPKEYIEQIKRTGMMPTPNGSMMFLSRKTEKNSAEPE